MKREYFITKKVISKILTQYGGRRKYTLSEKYTTDKQYQIIFTEKGNKCKWLSMYSYKGEVRVSLTDETGRVIQENYFTMNGEKKEPFLREMEELTECVEELLQNHTGSDLAQALGEYAQIIKNVATDYADETTIQELKADHPELDFMDDEELEEILKQAKELRVSTFIDETIVEQEFKPAAIEETIKIIAGQVYKDEIQKLLQTRAIRRMMSFYEKLKKPKVPQPL